MVGDGTGENVDILLTSFLILTHFCFSFLPEKSFFFSGGRTFIASISRIW